MKFEELNLKPELLKSISYAGYEECTLVQEKVCPISLQGRDVMVRSKTGSGKTAVFLVTFIEKFLKNNKSKALIVSPTRELALQIAQDSEVLSHDIPELKIGCFYGGVGYKTQEDSIKDDVNIYVGTPGRLIDFLKSGKIDFKNFDTVIIDEADRLFDMGFYPDIKKIFAHCVNKSERQTMLFSATLSTKVQNIAWEYMKDPAEIEIQPEQVAALEIKQELYHVDRKEKILLLLKLLKRENASSVLIFCNTKHRCIEVSERLKMNSYVSSYLIGDMAQEKRRKSLSKFKNGTTKILVATDVAARGLQIDDLPLVINYDIPEDFENYVHRIGRTARAGKTGKSITLACDEFIYGLEAIENYIKGKIPVCWIEGYDEVKDLSEGKSWHNPFDRKRPDRTGRRPDYKKKEVKRPERRRTDNKSDSFNKPQSPSIKKNRNVDYSKLSKMGVQQRMEYYKKEFASDLTIEKENSKKPVSNKQSYKKVPKIKTQPQKTVSHEPIVKEEEKTKKRGIKNWLLSKTKKKTKKQ
ncbi:MAG: DEAD/DEAH box helicase [Sphaerochaetaceae bacterium]